MSDSHPFLCFDTEDDSPELMAAGKSGFDKRVTQIAAITASGDTHYSRGNVKEFKRWLRQRPERFFYAHNCQYDIGNLFADELDELDITLVGGRMIRAVWGEKTFLDSLNIWPMAAAKVGKAFGIEKGKMDVRSKEYVFTDVQIIRAAMLFAWNFCAPLGIEVLPATLGGLCVKLWETWGGENVPDSMPHSRLALYGGRVELFKPRSESRDVCYTDLNSLYPSVMQQPFPGNLEPWKKTRSLPDFGIITADVHVPDCEIAPLPYREEESGRILFPTGTFGGTWTVAELRELERRGGRIKKIHEARGTSESAPVYRDFVQRLYAARLSSESEAEKLFFKLVMNNLYGRLAIQGEVGRTVYQTERTRGQGIPFGKKVLVKYQMPLPEFTNYVHGAYVTSLARLELLKHLDAVGPERMIYCDTDSTIFDCPGRKIPFSVGSELGQMKLVSWERSAECWAPKTYRAGKQYKAKGVPVRLAEDFIKRKHVEFDLPYKMREAITFFDRDNKKKLSVWRRVLKEWRTGYDRKRLTKAGRFHPCRINRPLA